jgi:hypothetical protein
MPPGAGFQNQWSGSQFPQKRILNGLNFKRADDRRRLSQRVRGMLDAFRNCKANESAKHTRVPRRIGSEPNRRALIRVRHEPDVLPLFNGKIHESFVRRATGQKYRSECRGKNPFELHRVSLGNAADSVECDEAEKHRSQWNVRAASPPR